MNNVFLSGIFRTDQYDGESTNRCVGCFKFAYKKTQQFAAATVRWIKLTHTVHIVNEGKKIFILMLRRYRSNQVVSWWLLLKIGKDDNAIEVAIIYQVYFGMHSYRQSWLLTKDSLKIH